MEDDKHLADLYRFFESGDKRYAAKIVERIVYGILTVVGLAVLYALLKQINL